MISPCGHEKVVLGVLAAAVLALSGCPQVPPTTDGTTDASATDGAQGGSDGGGEDGDGADETGEGEIPAEDHRTFFIAESVKFDGGGACQNDDLNTITRRLRRRLRNAGWTGLRFVDDNAWPEDFQESTELANGADADYGDAYRLTVYAGHGGPGSLQWGRPSDNGLCGVTIPVQTRLGRLAGDTAAAAMFLTSCTLLTSSNVLWLNFDENASRQLFGYHNSPYIGSGEPRRVFKRTQDGQSTKDAWLDEMEQNADLGKNSPVVLTLGVSGMEAMAVHGSTNLATGAGFIDNVGEPVDAYYFEWLNNGCTAICGGCSGVAPAGPTMPKMTVGSKVPIVQLTRPHRSAEDLADRSVVLVALVQGKPMSKAQRSRLDAWTRTVTSDGDIVVATLGSRSDPGRIQVAYDPSTDRLVVDNLDAREASRPDAAESPDESRRKAELEKASAIRDEVLQDLDASPRGDLLGVLHDSTFSVTTREAGLIDSEGVSPGSVPFEYLFSTFGQIDGYPIFGTQIEIGVTRHGKLSRIGISVVDVTKISVAKITRTPTTALETLARHIAANNPEMNEQEIMSARVGFVSPGGISQATLTAPELAVDYVVAYPGEGSQSFVSRRYPVSVSLITDSPPHPRPDPDVFENDDLGDPRHEDHPRQ